MKYILTCLLAAACLAPAARASVLEPENVGELVESATLNFTSPKGVWKALPEPCPALEEARKAGVGARQLPSWLRGKGVMTLASCRISYTDGAGAAAPGRILLVQDPTAPPDTVAVVSVSEGGEWTHACYRRSTEDADAAPAYFWYWRIDCVERFPD